MMQAVEAFTVKALGAVVLFLAPVSSGLTAVFWLVFIDMVFGIAASIKQGEKFDPRKLFHTPLKYAVYLGSIVATYQAEPHITVLASISATKIVIGIIGATELLSLLNKAQSLTGVDFARLRDALKPPKDLK